MEIKIVFLKLYKKSLFLIIVKKTNSQYFCKKNLIKSIAKKMKVLSHHIYEYKKGLRKLILHTLPSELRFQAEARLKMAEITFITRKVTEQKINIFFGDPVCIKVIELIGDKPLNQFSPEEDFILGTLLGYDRIQQCSRYLQFCQKQKNKTA